MDNLELSTAKFEGNVSILTEEMMSLLGVSKASIEEQIKPLFPEEFDISKNRDILPVVFNLAVVNKYNKNGDGIDTDVALACVEHFANKPINVEHKKDKIVGHILKASLSYGEKDFKEYDIKDFEGETKPFYITAAGVIYRHIFPKLSKANS